MKVRQHAEVSWVASESMVAPTIVPQELGIVGVNESRWVFLTLLLSVAHGEERIRRGSHRQPPLFYLEPRNHITLHRGTAVYLDLAYISLGKS